MSINETPATESSRKLYQGTYPAVDLNQELYTFTETAELLRCSRPYVYTLIRQGKLHAFRIAYSRKRLIPASSIEALIGEGWTAKLPVEQFCNFELDSGDNCERPPMSGELLCWSHQKRN
jgi:excisionase family DNA binding protein